MTFGEEQRAILKSLVVALGIAGGVGAAGNYFFRNPKTEPEVKVVNYYEASQPNKHETESKLERKISENSVSKPKNLFEIKKDYGVKSKTEPSHISEKGVKMIEGFEGLCLKPYEDIAGNETIGYGHLVKKGEHFDRISKSEAEILLEKDVSWAEKSVDKYVKVPLSQGQYDALVDFTYNVGSHAFKESTLLKELNSKNYEGAADQFLRWDHAGGKVSRGLLRRRKAERKLFLSQN